jgi:hypothetical protein
MIHVLGKVRAKRSALGKGLAASTALACAFATHACGPAGDLPDEAPSTAPEETVGTVSQGLDPNFVRGPINVAGNQTLDIGGTQTEVCVLTKVTGEFKNTGNRVQLKVVNGRWQLIGAGGAQGSAHCFKRAAFITAGTSSEIVQGPQQNVLALVYPNDCDEDTTVANMGDAVSYIAEMAGFFGGFGESIAVSQGISRDYPNSLTLRTCYDNVDQALNGPPAIQSSTLTFYSGPPRFTVPMPPAQFIGPNGPGGALQKGRADVAGTFKAKRDGFFGAGGQSTTMAPAKDAMCVLTRVSGEFDGTGEAAWIDTVTVNGVEMWRLNVQTAGNPCGFLDPDCQPQKGGVEAEARCYLRDQRTACTRAQSTACAQYGCGCASGQCSGGACTGSGCSVAQVQACAAYGCGCSAGTCAGGACP